MKSPASILPAIQLMLATCILTPSLTVAHGSLIIPTDLEYLIPPGTEYSRPAIVEITPDYLRGGAEDFQAHDPHFAWNDGIGVITFASTVGGQQESWLTWRIDGDPHWEDFIPLETESFEESMMPSTEFAGNGDFANLWISTRQESAEQKYYLRYRMIGDEAETIAKSPLPMESPSFIFHNGLPIVTWSEGEAGVFVVFMAEKNGSEWDISQLSHSSNSYDILPRVLPTTPPGVFWYHLDQNGFSIEALQKNEGTWTGFETGIQDLPTERLPWLFALDEIGDPGAIWIEPLPTGDQLFYYDPRLIEDFAITALPAHSGFDQLDPDASANSRMAFVWVEESKNGPRLQLFAPATDISIKRIKAPSQPRIRWCGEKHLTVTVISDRSLGGDGSLYSIDLVPGT